jgi:hypothetical protein
MASPSQPDAPDVGEPDEDDDEFEDEDTDEEDEDEEEEEEEGWQVRLDPCTPGFLLA